MHVRDIVSGRTGGRPMAAPMVLMKCRGMTNLSVGFAASSPWEGEPRGVAVFHGHAPWGRAGAQRLRGGILRISQTSDLLPMFLLKQWPPLWSQPCCFRQKRRSSTSSAQCTHWAPSPQGEGLGTHYPSSWCSFLTASGFLLYTFCQNRPCWVQ